MYGFPYCWCLCHSLSLILSYHLLLNFPIPTAENLSPRLIFTLQQPIFPGLSATIVQQLLYPPWFRLPHMLWSPRIFLIFPICPLENSYLSFKTQLKYYLLYEVSLTSSPFPIPWGLTLPLYVSLLINDIALLHMTSTYSSPSFSAVSLSAISVTYPWSTTVRNNNWKSPNIKNYKF